MLARLLVISGPAYVKKFVEKTGGITIIQHHLKRWWSIPTIWPICFAVLFGRDIAAINLERKFDLYNLLEIFDSEDGVRITCPEILPVLTGMLQSGLKSVTKEQADPDSPFFGRSVVDPGSSSWDAVALESTRLRSMSLNKELASLGVPLPYSPKLLCMLTVDRLGDIEGTTPCRIRFGITYHNKISRGHALQVARISRLCSKIRLRPRATLSSLPCYCKL